MKLEFEIVPDERRAKPRSNGLWDAVRAGKTVFIPGATSYSMSGHRTSLRGQGFRLHTGISHDPEGSIVWAERIEP